MLANSEKGKQARLYFIECKKQLADKKAINGYEAAKKLDMHALVSFALNRARKQVNGTTIPLDYLGISRAVSSDDQFNSEFFIELLMGMVSLPPNKQLNVYHELAMLCYEQALKNHEFTDSFLFAHERLKKPKALPKRKAAELAF
ncbi:MAG: hypothetical protein FWE37_02230 [Spirochaetaceae bacterium]|nr:hypothetical protein [Spirochaetaceae bacterium]